MADSGALVEGVKLLQEELAALIDEQNNRSLFVLTIVTVLALPLNIIAGLFGMNVGGIPRAQDPGGFWALRMEPQGPRQCVTILRSSNRIIESAFVQSPTLPASGNVGSSTS